MFGAMDTQPPEVPRSRSAKKPVDRWLAFVGVAVSVALFLVPKTPAVIVSLLVIIFALLCHPIWNFWWVEKALLRRMSAILALGFGLVCFGWWIWPRAIVTQWIHISRLEIFGRSENGKTHVYVNVGYVNDSDEKATIGGVYSYTLEANSGQMSWPAIIERLKGQNERVPHLEPFSVGPHEPRFFTISGPIFPAAQFKDFTAGKYALYTVGFVYGHNFNGMTRADFCAISVGNGAVISCPG